MPDFGLDWLLPLDRLLVQGGAVMWVILGATVLLWVLIIERYLFVWREWPVVEARLKAAWRRRQDRVSWYARQVRGQLVAEGRALLLRRLSLLRALTVVLPLLGLLGTVAGMGHTFEVMAVFGTGNVRGMAAGISQALLTTLAGLVGTLSGLYFSAHLDHRAERLTARLNGELTLEEAG